MAESRAAWLWLVVLFWLAGCAGRLEGEGEVDIFKFVLGWWLS
jgi:hypothetical protein